MAIKIMVDTDMLKRFIFAYRSRGTATNDEEQAMKELDASIERAEAAR